MYDLINNSSNIDTVYNAVVALFTTVTSYTPKFKMYGMLLQTSLWQESASNTLQVEHQRQTLLSKIFKVS